MKRTNKNLLSLLIVFCIVLTSWVFPVSVNAVPYSDTEILPSDSLNSVENAVPLNIASLNKEGCKIADYVNAEEFNNSRHIARLSDQEELNTYVFLNRDGSKSVYYMDENGAVTFTTGACVNSFTLEQPVKVLLNDRLVKLFKLFKGEKVKFTLGYDAISDEIIQTKVKFETSDVTITAILSCDDSMLRQFPVNAVRGRADATYPYSINMIFFQ